MSAIALRTGGSILAFGAVLTTVAPVAAHHPGHSGGAVSEGVRSLNGAVQANGDGKNRVTVLHDGSRSTETLDPTTTLRALLIAEMAVHPWLSMGGEASLWGVATDEETPVLGYGDTRLFVRLTPHGGKLTHRILTIGLAVSLPTRSVARPTDPGRPVSVSPHVSFTRTYAAAFWQLMAITTVETRAVGTAMDVSAAGQFGYRLFDKLTPAIGAAIDVRAASWCDGSYCSDGRPGEIDRAAGATRLYLLGGLGYQLAPWATLVTGIQVPITATRDYDLSANIGVNYSF